MEYLDYLKSILNDEEITLLEEAYSKEGLNGLRVNLLKSSPDTISSLFSLTKKHPFVKKSWTPGQAVGIMAWRKESEGFRDEGV